MRVKSLLLLMLALITLGGCHGESSITAGYGNELLTGQVQMESGGSAAGIEVSVVGTGLTTMTGDDGRFLFVDAPADALLRFRREGDVNGQLVVRPSSAPLIVVIDANGSAGSRRRGVAPGKLDQFEGVVVSAGAGSLTMTDSHQSEVTFVVTVATVIRHGQTPVLLEDLKDGDRVHVKATSDGTTRTAAEIIVQNTGDDDGDDEPPSSTMTGNGKVTAVGATSLDVLTQPRGVVTVRVDATTIIKRQGDRIALADIKVNDEVNSRGTRVDDQTLLAQQIEVRGKSKKNT